METAQIPAVVMAMNGVSAVLIVRWFVWPRLAGLPRRSALVPLVAFHWVRTLGVLAALPGMAGEHHDGRWATHVAIGDAATVVLAWLAVAALRSRARWALAPVWVFNVFGLLDVLNAMRNAVATGLPIDRLGAQAIVIALGPPALLVTHVAIFVLLLRRDDQPQGSAAAGP